MRKLPSDFLERIHHADAIVILPVVEVLGVKRRAPKRPGRRDESARRNGKSENARRGAAQSSTSSAVIGKMGNLIHVSISRLASVRVHGGIRCGEVLTLMNSAIT
jgi:hypothetical protein